MAAVVSLALGIGVNTAAFSALRAALDPHLAWKNPRELMDVGRQDASYPMLVATLDVTYPTFQLWQEHQAALAPLAAHDGNVVVIGGSIEPRSILVSRVPKVRTFGLLGGASRASAGRARHWSQSGLVVVQVGLALTLLSSFALVHRSLRRLEDAPIGISAEGRILVTLSLPARTPEEARGGSARWRESRRGSEPCPG